MRKGLKRFVVQAVIFDMDGLMFDTEALARDAWIAVGKRTGYPIGEDAIAQLRGATPEASAAVFKRLYGPGFQYPAAKAMRNAMVEEKIDRDGVPMKEGLIELLDYLAEHRIPAAVASSSPRRTIEKYLSLTGITRYFAAVISAEDIARSKPAPDVFLAAARLLHTPAAHCLVLEDSANGLAAAHNAGIACICIPDIAPPDGEALSYALTVLPSLHHVKNWLQEQL